MIQLDVHSFCHKCPHFDPEVISHLDADVIPVITIVRCINHERCEAISNVLKNDTQKENKNV